MAIVTVRVLDELKLKMKELNINWSEEIREFIRKRIDEKERRRKIKEVLELAKASGSVSRGFATKSVREDRDSHWRFCLGDGSPPRTRMGECSGGL